jgi:putative phosphoesterase
MKVAILSDIHDNVWNLATALEALGEADALICCGDLCSPFVLELLGDGFKGPAHIVFGNNDGDLYRIAEKAHEREHVQLHGAFFEGELGGQRFAVNHYPEIALPIAESGRYDVVCYGHNHDYKVEMAGSTLTINPGTLLGYSARTKDDVDATFVIYDTVAKQARGYTIAPQRRDEQRKVLPIT